MDPVMTSREWALGIPLGWVPPSSSDKSSKLIGHVLYQDRVIPLDQIAYTIWTDALIGEVDFSRCGDRDYLPPGLAIEKRHTGQTASPEQIADTARHLRENGLVWHFDPTDPNAYRKAEGFEVTVQGIPIGNVDRSDRYRIAHNDGVPALDIDGVSYMLWLRWWSDPSILGSAHYVAHELGMRRTEVVGRAVGALIAGMRVGLVYVARGKDA